MTVDMTIKRHPFRALFNKKRRYTVTFHFPQGEVSATANTKAAAWAGAAGYAAAMLGVEIIGPNPYTEES